MTPRRPAILQDELRQRAQVAFLEAYKQLGTISAAARTTGIDRQTHYDWLNESEDYAALWTLAQEDADESLLYEAIRRGRDGTEVGIYHQGERVATELKFSDNLLMFMIKGRMPQFRDRMELTGANGGPVQVQAVRSDALARLDPVALDALRRLNGGAMAQLQAPAEDGEVVEPEASQEAALSDDAKPGTGTAE